MKKYTALNIAKQFVTSLLTFALVMNSAFAVTFTVNDSGHVADASAGDGVCATAGAVCTLRAALEEANALVGTDTIVFDANSRTITTTSTLTVGSQLTIDGNGSPTNMITIDGNDGAFDLITVTSNGDSSTIEGLYLIDGGQHGINIASGADSVNIGTFTPQQGNVIGLTTSSVADGMAGSGIYNQGTTTTILGNVISSNATGISIVAGSKDVTITGNTIGATPDTTAARGNGTGINVQGTVALDGGNGGTEGLVIASLNSIVNSTDDGIHIGNGAGAITGTIKIQRNNIGMNSSGTAMGNIDEGIIVETDASGADITIGTDGDGTSDSVEGNYIGSNGASGINVQEGDDVVIAGNKIGLNSSGTARGNTGAGVLVGTSSVGPNTVRIGSDNADANEINTISNNGAGGVSVLNGTIVNIAGNYIGLNASGAGSHGNTGAGIAIASGGGGGQITTLTIGGNGTAAAGRNFISNSTGGFNGAIDVSTTASGATVTIKSNIIGLAADLLTAAANAAAGMYLTAAANYTIGSNGDGSNDSTEYNVVSNETSNGIYVGNGPLTAIIAGNIIGLASSNSGTTWTTAAGNGTSAAAGSKNGIKIASNSLTALTIGGDATEERNVIASNPEDGINVTDAGSAIAYTIRNNYIGLASDGSTARANSGAGLDLDDGGAITLTDNVISNNAVHGVDISAGTSLTATGNKIGTIATGLASAGNTGAGILITASTMASVIIGGSTAGQGNTIAAQLTGSNTGFGISITDLSAITTAVSILGNYIGIGSDGTTVGTVGQSSYMGNASQGIKIAKGAVTIGGDNDLANSLLAAGNVISNNGTDGIYLTSNVTSADVYGNVVGAKKNVTSGLYTDAAGNGGNGFMIDNGSTATSILIGSAAGTTTASRRNYFNYNGLPSVVGNEYGVYVKAPGGAGGPATVKIKNNYIGADYNGTAGLGNYNGGVLVERGTAVTIGTDLDGSNDADEGNVISGNGGGADGTTPGSGIRLTDTITAVGIYGNIIGMNSTKTVALANIAGGIVINSLNAAATITVGSTSSNGRNYISGNGNLSNSGSSGILVGASNTAGTILNIVNNYIGTNGTGTTAIPNSLGGINIADTSSRVTTTIGDGTTAGRNLISGNTGGGITITGGNVTINNNYLGTTADGTTALPNATNEVSADSSAGASNISYLKISANIINTLSANVLGVTLQDVITWNETNTSLTSDNTWTGRAAGNGTAFWWKRYVGATLTAYGPKICYDGKDNDGDGFTDYSLDPGCDNVEDNDEYHNLGGGAVILASAPSSGSQSNDAAARAEADVQAKAEADAKAKAEAEAQAKTEADAKAQAAAKADAAAAAAKAEADAEEDIEAEDDQPAKAEEVSNNVKDYIIAKKLDEGVNVVTDAVLGKGDVNVDLIIQDLLKAEAQDQETEVQEVPKTYEQQLVQNALDKLDAGEELTVREQKKLESTVEATVQDAVSTFYEKAKTEGKDIPEVPVVLSNGKTKKISKDTKVKFTLDAKKAQDLQDLADSKGEDAIIATPSTIIGNNNVAALLTVMQGGKIGDPLAAEKVFFNGLEGLAGEEDNVADLKPKEPKTTNIFNGAEVAPKFMMWLAGPKAGQHVSIFAVDKVDPKDPTTWKIYKLGKYQLDSESKTAVEVDLSDKMDLDLKKFTLVVQDDQGKGSATEVSMNKNVEMKMDTVTIKSGEKIISADLTSDHSGWVKSLKASVMMASATKETEPVEEKNEDSDAITIRGYAEPGSVVFVTWKSVVKTSTVIADASQGYFEVRVPKELEKGDHTAYTYSYNKSKKTASSFAKVFFSKYF